ncbi:LITAF-like zinc ribbon domain protein (macronuclear) [Tetrahymena thermophila SB210]|uniref:LITAF-like zinc ribbon domain protein n=1 Tax=Tetrahymena thermophila (strain SB210) TaxID=312017 RepID=I7LUF4_TETTS|nr:LITAF-like zinc ribbon domain protein [Tetrahymena thermophila SB210]EAR92946.1 LITAF-like zinc ribbon domain protein [Tetrahymena thermophila SB210]|eukprot:XP_001013191.1 LITAF-like zinc ribbon domain protein [Tetrahymena thermophila SB210]
MQQLKNRNKEEKEEQLTLGDQPVKIKCGYCAANQKTEVKFKNGVISYALCFLAFLLLPFLVSIIAILLIFVLTKNLVHVCSCCENQLGNDGKIIYALKFKDEIVTLKAGEMGFIMTRKLIITIILIALNVIVLIYKINHTIQGGHHHKYGFTHAHDQIYPIQSNWTDFYNECNIKLLMGQGQQQMKHCYYKYIGKTVSNWEGYIIRVEDLRGSLKQFFNHAVTILVQMDPTEQTEEQKFPDLQLTFDSEVADFYSNFLDQINRGDKIGFNATIKSIGFEEPRHLHVIQIEKLEGFKLIEPHVHHHGRYKDLNRSFRKSKDLTPEVQLEKQEQTQESQEQQKKENNEQNQEDKLENNEQLKVENFENNQDDQDKGQ